MLLKYPQRFDVDGSEEYHARLTDAGKQLLSDRASKYPKLEPGVHYCVKEGWISGRWIFLCCG